MVSSEFAGEVFRAHWQAQPLWRARFNAKRESFIRRRPSTRGMEARQPAMPLPRRCSLCTDVISKPTLGATPSALGAHCLLCCASFTLVLLVIGLMNLRHDGRFDNFYHFGTAGFIA
jgi:hypothetical protein